MKTIGKENEIEKLEFEKEKLWKWNDPEEIKNEKALSFLVSKLTSSKLDSNNFLRGKSLIYTLIKIIFFKD